MTSLFNHKLSLASALLLSLLSGCTDPTQAIRLAKEFGQTANEFKDKTDKLANDIYASCLRRARYIDLVAIPGQRADQERIGTLEECDNFNKRAADGAIHANTIITDYIKAVGHLAGDKGVSFESDFATIEKSLIGLSQSGLPFAIPQQAISQGVQIANSVFEWIARRYRGVEISKAVICSNAPLAGFTTGLSNAYNNYYINGILDNEEQTIRRYYNGIATSQAAAITTTRQPIGVRDYEALHAGSYESLMAIRNNRAAARRYVTILKLTSDANSKIANEFLKAGYKYTDIECQAYLNPGKSPTPSISSETPSNPHRRLGPTSKIRIANILSDYNRQVKSELDNMRL